MASYDDTATVSGSVVGFSNGADSVPLKNWLVTLPTPTLTGVSSVNVISAGGNIFDGVLESGWIDNNGADSPNVDRVRSKNLLHCLPSTSYYVTCSDSWRVYWYDSTQAFISYSGTYSANRAVTSPSNAMYFRLAIIATEPTGVGMNYPSTDTSAQTPKAQTSYTANLGRTVYGGQVDVVKGEGTETHGKYSVTGQESGDFLAGTNNNGNRIGLNGFGLAQKPLYTGGECNIDDSVNKACLNSGTWTIGSWCIYTDNRLYFVVPNEYTTFETALQYLVDNHATFTFPLATPTDFTFTGQEVPTRLGYNAFWSDQGNTELTYYKDGYGFTSVTVHKETPDGEPVEETRKLHRIIYEGQVDVISGTGLIYRGESGTQYDPPEQISFTPIEIATDEGENTLYADQGASAITYRKAVE